MGDLFGDQDDVHTASASAFAQDNEFHAIPFGAAVAFGISNHAGDLAPRRPGDHRSQP